MLKQIVKQFFKSKLNAIGFLIVLTLFAIAIAAPLLAGNKPLLLKYQGHMYFPVFGNEPQNISSYRDLTLQKKDFGFMPPIPYSPTEYNLDNPLIAPGHEHFLGTDEQGRDIASRMIHGSRISLSVGFVAVGIYLVVGVIIGAVAGYYGGRVDIMISRFMEMVMCFPTFFLILAVLAFVGPSLINIMIVIGLTSWTGVARLVRGEFLKLRDQDFVSATRALGLRVPRILFKHILPNAMAPVMVSATFGVASSILIESSLSFLGFGVQPPTPSWGDILSQSREFMDIAWWLTFFPGFAIFITITSFNIVGEGLRDVLDPKLKT
ncbi:ABC transporter permease [bacterium]|nr:ABC transporter permease [bacterium]